MEGKSGLFYEAVRVIREMREATNNTHPRFAVMENVVGMFSSKTNGQSDFLEVLHELIHLKDKTLSIPVPKGGWSTAGEIVGDGFSLGWRTFDAQFWGVAQRRRRCYIVIDFAGERAGEILFDETRLRGNPPQSGLAGQGAAGNTEAGAGGSVPLINKLVVFEPGAASRLGGSCWHDGVTCTLRAHMGDNQLAVAIENHPSKTYDVRQTSDGTINERTHAYETDTSRALDTGQGVPGSNHGGIAVVEPKAYGICSLASNSMQSKNPHSGIYEADTSRTLDCNGGNPSANQGGIAVVSIEGNGARPSHHGTGFSEDGVSFSLNCVEKHGVTYSMTTGSYTQICEEQVPTLQARDWKDAPVVARPQYIVRRLTPTECALLQGFPHDWCAGLETPKPSKEEIAFFYDVWETHRRITGESSTPKNRKQIVSWLRDPHSDSAEYKMWGNGVCINNVVFVLGGIAFYTQ
jgi:DNA (cytosine-5)-methyltransferase 1